MLRRSLRALLPPLILAALVFFVLREPITLWLYGEEIFDQEAIKEWVREARNTSTLPELVKEYLELAEHERRCALRADDSDGRRALRVARDEAANKREAIEIFLKTLGEAPTKVYPQQLPLFPVIYRLTVTFDEALELPPIVWDAQLPVQSGQYRELPPEPIHEQAFVSVDYHLHAFLQRQVKERVEATRRLWLSGLGILFAFLALFWVYLTQRRERARTRQRLLEQQQLNEAERLRLEEELRRQEAERKHEEAERQNLELKSQLFANIGIMAGSYAHNIKNLLVRPNDLLRRCIDEQPADESQQAMLKEVKQTLGTVTERLQQILQTVRRDPSKAEKTRIELGALLGDMHAAWAELAREKWKLVLDLDVGREPLWIEGDLSHLQQAFENLMFNARDATFEMRNRLREQARRDLPASSLSRSPPREGPITLDVERRQALISAAGWKGRVVLAARRQGDLAVVEVRDNGVGMSEEVRRRCTETHFSTKRDNALFAGLSAGMGLGLSFVQVILEHHRAALEVESQPLQGAIFRVSFPLAASSGNPG
jgi:two-component system, cell cycle sensor histidine kinase and response regulator CckA